MSDIPGVDESKTEITRMSWHALTKEWEGAQRHFLLIDISRSWDTLTIYENLKMFRES